MIRWEPTGATKATGGLESPDLQASECFRTGIPFNAIVNMIIKNCGSGK